MRRALEDIQRRTAPGSVLATADLDGPAYEDVAEIHDIALAALTEAEQVGEQLRSEA
jgi:LmbE family N-acetylglucosaminyl deacetylase